MKQYNVPVIVAVNSFFTDTDAEKDFVIKKHDCISQGVFIKYLTVDNEEESVEGEENAGTNN